ncbi:MAG: restriction endonuclease subunit S, partial [Desulfitobacteriaceae bacterium]|nr:restriction endonuclease subunit S [Desulfitobacteriaceae bacterium]
MNGIKYRQPEEMKDSGVEWQGFTGLEWKKTKLKYIASVRNGATPSTSDPDYWDGNIYWFTPTDFGNQSLYESARTITERGLNSCGTNLVPKGSVIITCRAPIGGLGIIKCEEAAYNQGCKGVVPTNVISQYLYYLLLSAANFIQSRGKGTTFMELSSYDLNNLVVEVPNKKSQRKIANFLDLKTVQFDSII